MSTPPANIDASARMRAREQLLSQPERTLGIWRTSRWYSGFWFKAIITLGLWVILFWQQNYITLTTRRVTQRRGSILNTNETSLSIENITDVTVNRGPLGTIFGYGDINIQTPGSSGAEISMVAVPNPERLRNLIFDLADGRLDDAQNLR
ncbi:PH domain-containing protein [Anaerolineae bacterium CFX9]|jgi:membrane protein YdbS with pleckstrin-like domain|nr:PH domain-containing protein [Anaerolineae bacterium CFX9]